MSTKLTEELGDVASELQEKLPGVWRSLVLAERKASKDPSYAPKFKALLDQSVARIKANRADVLGGESLQQAVREFLLWYDREAESRGISHIESQRGILSHQDWMAKWHPVAWKRFSHAYQRVVETGAKTAVDALRPAALELLDLYTKSE